MSMRAELEAELAQAEAGRRKFGFKSVSYTHLTLPTKA